jgi:hypothetical protein
MLTRRIATSACALCLAVPAAAGAQPIHDPAAGHAVVHGGSLDRIGSLTAKQLAAAYGTTKSAGPQDTTMMAMGPSGTTKSTDPHGTTMAMGPSGTTKTTAQHGTTMALGPSGTTKTTAQHGTTMAIGPSGTTKATAPARVTVASDGDGTNGWRIAAGSEAALLAALALGSALILRARRSAPRMGM